MFIRRKSSTLVSNTARILSRPGRLVTRNQKLHGGAGAGKSTVINILAMMAQKILLQPGDNPDHPYVIKTAFTGTAASLIQGQTLSKVFSFAFNSEASPVSDKFRDQRRCDLQNLKMVIIDEISMVKSEQLYLLDLRLQDFTQKDEPFGGVSIFTFGDLMQLSPIMGSWIFADPRTKDGKFTETHALAPRWKMFSCVVLEKNHRQGSDKEYADLLNKIRTGDFHLEDLEPLRERIRNEGHPDLEQADLWIHGVRRAVTKRNNDYLKKLGGEEVVLKAVHHQPQQKKFKVKVDEKDGTVGGTAFLDTLRIKIGARTMIIHNVDVVDGITNGQLGVVISYIKTRTGNVDKIVFKPRDPTIGDLNRAKYPSLTSKYPECIFIEKVSFQYSMTKSGTSGSSRTIIQFPLTLAFSITAHKIQVLKQLEDYLTILYISLLLGSVSALSNKGGHGYKLLFPACPGLCDAIKMSDHGASLHLGQTGSREVEDKPRSIWRTEETGDDILEQEPI